MHNHSEKTITFSKYMSREHSLFYAYVWTVSNRELFDKLVPGTNIKNMIFLRNKLGVLEVYYDMEELDSVASAIAEAVSDSPKLLDAIIAEFYLYWERLFPYVNGTQKIKDIKELKAFYENWKEWWGPMAYIFMIPDSQGVPKEMAERSLKVRQDTQEYSDSVDRVFTDFISEKYPRHAVIATLLAPEEVYGIDMLSADEIAAIKARSEGFALLTSKGVTSLVSSEQLDHKIKAKEFLIEKISASKDKVIEIKGTVACRGSVTGKVRLVLNKSDLESVQEGDIMVAYATSPDYVPAMKKCAAIVTDEGGVVCHAAIVSRELGIPCLVGTYHATDILKTGDLIELDAIKGRVTILERSPGKVSGELI